MSDLVGNPEDRFSRVEAHIMEKCLFSFLVKCFANGHLPDKLVQWPLFQKIYTVMSFGYLLYCHKCQNFNSFSHLPMYGTPKLSDGKE